MNDWNSLRFFLAVQRAGSLAGAASLLQVDATTVGRRIERLESAIGGRLFQRGPSGFHLTPKGTAVLPAAEEAERAIQAVERRAMGEDEEPSGRISLTTADLVIQSMLPTLAKFCETHPRVELDLVITSRALDLSRREADVAVRSGRVTDPNLVARRVGKATLGVYASKSYLARRGRPRGTFAGHDVIMYSGELTALSDELRLPRVFSGARVVAKTNSVVTLLNAILAGMGIGPLVAQAARVFPDLELVRAEPLARRDTYLVAHRDLVRSGRVRALWNHLVDHFHTFPIS